jgi:hypothetical protein
MAYAITAERQNKNNVKKTTLRLTPYAWGKLLFLRDAGLTEIGAFGISSDEDLLLIEDVKLVKQRCDWASVAFDDEAVADFFDREVDAGRVPQQFGRVWVHTHPGRSAAPSGTDEETFSRVFGGCDWSVMLIVAKERATYARLQFGVGPRAAMEIPVEVEYGSEFAGSSQAAWQEEYEACVQPILDVAPVDRRDIDYFDQVDDFWDRVLDERLMLDEGRTFHDDRR